MQQSHRTVLAVAASLVGATFGGGGSPSSEAPENTKSQQATSVPELSDVRIENTDVTVADLLRGIEDPRIVRIDWLLANGRTSEAAEWLIEVLHDHPRPNICAHFDRPRSSSRSESCSDNDGV